MSYLFCGPTIFLTTFKNKLVQSDIKSIVAIYFVFGFNTFMYNFIGQKLGKNIILEQIDEHEQVQFKDMFNSLQEGIIVLEGPKIEDFDSQNYEFTKKEIEKCKITFVNDLGTRIFKLINGIKDYFKEENVTTKSAMTSKIFFQYKQKNFLEEDKKLGSKKLVSASSFNSKATMEPSNISFSVRDVLMMS